MSSIELFFDSDDDQYEVRCELGRMRRRIRDASNPLELDDDTFTTIFRLSKEAFVSIYEEVDEKVKVMKNVRGVSTIIKLAVVLRFLAQGSYQSAVGNDFHLGVAQPTVSHILQELLPIMESSLCPKYINCTYTEEEENQSRLYFYRKSGIPNVIGCIDGTHIKIIKPNEEIRHWFYNRKGFYSLNALVFCDHQMRIRYINAKNPGSSHDSHIWNNSSLKAFLESDKRQRGKDYLILGDGGYPLSSLLLTPYRDAEESSVRGRFNTKHAQARNIVERTIGLLKSRFRCTLGARELHYGPEKATRIVIVCAALHNICINYRVRNVEVNAEMEENLRGYADSTAILEHSEAGRLLRDSIASSL